MVEKEKIHSLLTFLKINGKICLRGIFVGQDTSLGTK